MSNKAEVIIDLNDLLKTFFAMNAIFDNIAYSLDCELRCQKVSKIFHENVAHVIVGDKFADKLSTEMVKNSFRPRRKSFDGREDVYDSIVDAFDDVVDAFVELKNQELKLLEKLESYKYEFKSIVLIIEEILLDTQKMLKQAYVWQEKAYQFQGSPELFNVHFDEFWI